MRCCRWNKKIPLRELGGHYDFDAWGELRVKDLIDYNNALLGK